MALWAFIKNECKSSKPLRDKLFPELQTYVCTKVNIIFFWEGTGHKKAACWCLRKDNHQKAFHVSLFCATPSSSLSSVWHRAGKVFIQVTVVFCLFFSILVLFICTCFLLTYLANLYTNSVSSSSLLLIGFIREGFRARMPPLSVLQNLLPHGRPSWLHITDF